MSRLCSWGSEDGAQVAVKGRKVGVLPAQSNARVVSRLCGQVGRAERADGSVGKGRAKESETSTFPGIASLAASLERPTFLPTSCRVS